MAALTEVDLGSNPIGFPTSVSLRPGAKTGGAVKVGIIAAVGGRWGEVTTNPGTRRGYTDYQAVKKLWLYDGTESEMSERARSFGDQLERRYQIPVAMVDERLSTRAAREAAELDKGATSHELAAVLIVESWLAQTAD